MALSVNGLFVQPLEMNSECALCKEERIRGAVSETEEAIFQKLWYLISVSAASVLDNFFRFFLELYLGILRQNPFLKLAVPQLKREALVPISCETR